MALSPYSTVVIAAVVMAVMGVVIAGSSVTTSVAAVTILASAYCYFCLHTFFTKFVFITSLSMDSSTIAFYWSLLSMCGSADLLQCQHYLQFVPQ